MPFTRRPFLTTTAGVGAAALVVLALGAQAPQAAASRAPTGRDCLRAVTAGPPKTLRQRTFDAAASTYGVPSAVLLGVSYMESQWDDHGATPSVAGGYGPMHLTDIAPPSDPLAKGDGSTV